jgi:hypothetical protein
VQLVLCNKQPFTRGGEYDAVGIAIAITDTKVVATLEEIAFRWDSDRGGSCCSFDELFRCDTCGELDCEAQYDDAGCQFSDAPVGPVHRDRIDAAHGRTMRCVFAAKRVVRYEELKEDVPRRGTLGWKSRHPQQPDSEWDRGLRGQGSARHCHARNKKLAQRSKRRGRQERCHQTEQALVVATGYTSAVALVEDAADVAACAVIKPRRLAYF